ncbi:MAG: hypothetical protein ACYTGG_01445 [Planctomycetota bacterium]|jgi:hypothetical protein
MHRAAFTISLLTSSGLAPLAAAGSIEVLDQIGGPGDVWMAPASSSSQFPPGQPQSAFSTVDNFIVTGEPVRITRIQAVVNGLQNFVGFDLIQSWNVQIYSSLDAATSDYFGDSFSQSFDTPDDLTSGFSSFGGFASEIATFNVDVILEPGEYWLGVAMENDSAINGTVGIRHSIVGDGPALFAVPSQGDSFPLGFAAAYSVTGMEVPGPAAASLFGLAALLAPTRRRRR